MLDGTYDIEINTPFGGKPGTVTMHTEGEKVIADIDAPIVGKQQVEGRLDGEDFVAEGMFKLKLVGEVTYSLRGKAVGDELLIAIDSSKGQYELKGKRV